MKFKSTLGLFVLAATMSSHAGGFFTGNDLLAQVHDKNNSSIAVGYISGVFDSGNGKEFCSPGGVSIAQVVDIVVSLVTALPNVRHLPANDLASFALKKAFPCPKQAPIKDNSNT